MGMEGRSRHVHRSAGTAPITTVNAEHAAARRSRTTSGDSALARDRVSLRDLRDFVIGRRPEEHERVFEKAGSDAALKGPRYTSVGLRVLGCSALTVVICVMFALRARRARR